MTLVEYKRRHFMRLSKVHEEVQPRLKTIRTRLHALHLDCQPPKLRRTTEKKKTVQGADLRPLPQVAVCGKAGRSYYVVRVGEENHLYRTTGPSQPYGPGAITVLDLPWPHESRSTDQTRGKPQGMGRHSPRGILPVCDTSNNCLLRWQPNSVRNSATVDQGDQECL